MRFGWKTASAVVSVAIVAAVAGGAAAVEVPGLPAQVVDITPPTSVATYPTTDYGKASSTADDRTGTTTWRVVEDTGNCCENYLKASSAGVLYDFGGTYINFTADGGLTWKSVRPQVRDVNGEGTIVLAPNGDVLGVGWDPYSGDHLQAFKYEAATGRWLYQEMPLHTPFYDREWLSVVPGPFTIDGRVVPYITFVKGGWPSKELWLYSTDGLTYVEVKSKFVDRTLNGSESRTLPLGDTTGFDWIQPNANTGMTALGSGGLLAGPDYPSSAWSRFDGSEFYGYRLPDGSLPEGAFQVDSLGRVHNVVPHGNSFTYRISGDGGATWKSTDVRLPDGNTFEEWDFVANSSAGVAAVAIHAQDSITGYDRDLVVKLDIGKKGPRATRLYQVGLGDLGATAGVGNDVRFDFATVTVLPDGRVVTSFLDSTTTSTSPTTGAQRPSPALAIEGGTNLTDKVDSEVTPVGTAQGPIEGTVLIPAPGAGERVGGVTSAYLEFESLAGMDNRVIKVEATYAVPADVDLYLQRLLEDGSWSGDLAAGTSSSLSGEILEGGPLLAGRYRIEAHNWAGPPVQVTLKLTFFNGAGEAGT